MATFSIANLLSDLIAETRVRHPSRPALIGVAGAQGSGKSHQCSAFAAVHPSVAHFSLDDVYKTRAEREQIAASCVRRALQFGGSASDLSADDCAKLKALYVTRGPPGTHDLGLANGLIARLRQDAPTPLPRFDKRADDRAPEATWPVFKGPAQAILVDGWCLGANTPSDAAPLLVVPEDIIGQWQKHTDLQLGGPYSRFFDAFDQIIYLQAPNFEIVRRWRGEQEEAMLGRAMTAEESAALDRFIMHYERITRAMLAGHHRAGWIVRLDENRNILGIEQR
ncbi:MAG: kinase [Terricaulis sp.]